MGPEVNSPFSGHRPIGSSRSTRHPPNSTFVITRPRRVTRRQQPSAKTTKAAGSFVSTSTMRSQTFNVTSSFNRNTTISMLSDTNTLDYEISTLKRDENRTSTLSIIVGVLSAVVIGLVIIGVYLGIKRRKMRLEKIKFTQSKKLVGNSHKSSTEHNSKHKNEELLNPTPNQDRNFQQSFSNIEYDHLDLDQAVYETIPEIDSSTYDKISYSGAYQDLTPNALDHHIYLRADTEEYERPISTADRVHTTVTAMADKATHHTSTARSDTTIVVEDVGRDTTHVGRDTTHGKLDTVENPRSVTPDYDQPPTNELPESPSEPDYSVVDYPYHMYHEILQQNIHKDTAA